MNPLRMIACAALLLISGATQAFDEWTPADSWREAAYLTLHTIDWAQTHAVARDPRWNDRDRELNPILGNRPSAGSIDRYFALTALAHVGVAVALPEKWRHTFQYVTVGFQAGVVARTYSFGVGARF